MFKPSLGVFADNIDLYRFVNTQNKNSYSYGRLSHIYNKDTPFCCNGYNTYKLFYRLENIDNFLPYTYLSDFPIFLHVIKEFLKGRIQMSNCFMSCSR